jgi:hypothetical protein
MTDTAATVYDVRSWGRPAAIVGRLGAALARHLLLAIIAAAAVASALAAVALAAGWLLATTQPGETGTIARKSFGPRLISLVPRVASEAWDSKAADVIVFPPSLAEITAPVQTATRTPAGKAATPARVRRVAVVQASRTPLPPEAPPEIARLRKPAARTAVASAPPISPPAPASLPGLPPTHDKAAPQSASVTRTAIYDISARKVYLPDGKILEAHSGLGDWRDNPRYVSLKMRGPTPPNTYDLTLRERLFHGVRAIRLTPVDDDKMFGRDGMLAHTYMLGPQGDSNGCVSFKNYRAFLEAYLKGDVDRLVVVAQHGAALARTARARGRDVHFAANGP